jgi:hypothetical protein
MHKPKRGNGKRLPKRRNRRTPALGQPEVIESEASKPLPIARLTLHERDPITDRYEQLFTLFYESYRGYTIYSTREGPCCIHGRDGCLRIAGRYACFPDIEEAKALIKHFVVDGRTSQESMNRSVPEDEYLCLNSGRQRHGSRPHSQLAGA